MHALLHVGVSVLRVPLLPLSLNGNRKDTTTLGTPHGGVSSLSGSSRLEGNPPVYSQALAQSFAAFRVQS